MPFSQALPVAVTPNLTLLRVLSICCLVLWRGHPRLRWALDGLAHSWQIEGCFLLLPFLLVDTGYEARYFAASVKPHGQRSRRAARGKILLRAERVTQAKKSVVWRP
jgi:hypothetical protein